MTFWPGSMSLSILDRARGSADKSRRVPRRTWFGYRVKPAAISRGIGWRQARWKPWPLFITIPNRCARRNCRNVDSAGVPGHWVDADSKEAAAHNIVQVSTDDFRNSFQK